MILGKSSGAAVLVMCGLGLLACSSSTPKPLPGGPPPEYETPRTYNLEGSAPAAPAVSDPVPGVPAAPTSSGPGAARPEPDPAKPGDSQAAPPN
jgi:hypothetical protein